MNILILNGPNLNLLGKREPELYGGSDFESFYEILQQDYSNVNFEYFQSNHEGFLLDKLHEDRWDGIVMNPGGLAHTSIVLLDAIKAIETPVIEVHITDVMKREPYRHVLLSSQACKLTLSGRGLDGYKEAVECFLKD